MKSTGIVRRIDELGRIVIPKEIRAKLRIKEGDNLEIYVKEDSVILSKFSNVKSIIDIADKLVETLNIILKNNIIVTDTQSIVVSNRTKFSTKKINVGVLEKLRNSEFVEGNLLSDIFISDNDECNYLAARIIVNGDLKGSLIFLKEENITITDKELLNMAAKFLSKYLEE